MISELGSPPTYSLHGKLALVTGSTARKFTLALAFRIQENLTLPPLVPRLVEIDAAIITLEARWKRVNSFAGEAFLAF
jgi:hypothetical protein